MVVLNLKLLHWGMYGKGKNMNRIKLLLSIVSIWLMLGLSGEVNAQEVGTPIYANSLQEGYLYSTYISGDEMPVLSSNGSENTALKMRLLEAMSRYQEKVDVLDLGIVFSDDTYTILQNAFREVLDENPDLFYVSWIYCDSWENSILDQIGIQYAQDFKDASGNLDSLKVNAYEVALSEALSCVKSEMTNVEKLLALHDYLVFHCTYDYGNYLNGTIPSVSYSAYGALVNKTAVCNGYALAMADLIKHIGLSGYVVASSNHAWNLVYVDGNWYHIDTTWDDPVSNTVDNNWNREGNVRHHYFMISDEEIKALDTSSHGSWWIQNNRHTTLPKATKSGSYPGYIFRDKAYETSSWYYAGNWYYVTGESAAWFGGTVATSKIDGSGYREIEELGHCLYAQIQGDYLYTSRQAGWNTDDSAMDGLYATRLGGAFVPERVMTLLVNRGYKDFVIQEFAVYGNIIAVVMSHKETEEWVRLEYMTHHRETEAFPVIKLKHNLRWKNYPDIDSFSFYDEMDTLGAVLVYADGTEIPITFSYWQTEIIEKGNYVCDVYFNWKGLKKVVQVTNNSQWPIQDIFSNDTNWIYNAAKYTYDKGIMSGTEYNVFEPDKTMERCMLAQILYNMENKPRVIYHKQFEDVLENQWYSKAITWAYDNGIVKGYSGNRFGAVDYVTREQMAQMLMKYAQIKGYNTNARVDISGYTDAGKVSSWAGDAIRWAVATGVMKGKGDKLDPTGYTTRAEGAAMIKNFCEKVAK